MSYAHNLRSISDDELLRRLSELLSQSRRVESDLVAHIGEVDERRLYAREACSSMFVYCTEVLHLSEREAYLRITVARESRKHPVLLEMLSDGRLHLTASSELREKLERLKTLLHVDLAEVIDVAVTEKLERVESKRYGFTKAPRKSLDEADTSPKSRYIPAPVMRTVRKRDGNQCRFVKEQGRHCTERNGLEFHHRDPFGRGGDHKHENIVLMCHAHNLHLAEQDYGKEKMKEYRGNSSHVSEPGPIYYSVTSIHAYAC
jgi:hypothetical protein